MIHRADIRILLVDDHELIRSIVRQALGVMGYSRIVEATSGDEAMGMTKRGRPHVVICDINMKPIDGLTFLRHLRADSNEVRHTPVIMLTSVGEREMVMEAMRAGANAYIRKPASPKILHERILAVLPNL